MPIPLCCPACRRPFAVADALAGGYVECPKCAFTIPVPEPIVEDPAPPAPAPLLAQSAAPAPAPRLPVVAQSTAPQGRAVVPPAPRRTRPATEPASRRRDPRNRTAGNQFAAWLMAGLTVVVALAVGFGVWWFFNKRDAPRYFESEGGYSFVPPRGWEMRTMPNLRYQAAIGPPARGFAPNINILDEVAKVSLDEYVKSNLVQLKTLFPKHRVLTQDTTRTDDGLEARRVVFANELNGTHLRQTAYFLERGTTKFVVTCSVPATDGEDYDDVFEKCLKTFRFENK